MTRTETPQPAAGPRLGKGIYTRVEIATILRMPYGKVNRWVTDWRCSSMVFVVSSLGHAWMA